MTVDQAKLWREVVREGCKWRGKKRWCPDSRERWCNWWIYSGAPQLAEGSQLCRFGECPQREIKVKLAR